MPVFYKMYSITTVRTEVLHHAGNISQKYFVSYNPQFWQKRVIAM